MIQLTKRCLAPAAADRPRDAGMLAADLTAYLESVEQRLRRAELAGVTAKARARMTVVVATSALVLVLAGMGGWLWNLRAREERRRETGRPGAPRRLG